MASEEDDFEYNDDEIENSGVFRWLQAAVVLFALGGFFGLAWYAYKSGEGTDDKDVELVKVESEPVKEAPANPGGMQIPNQDKTVYGLINGNKPEKPVVERIVPSAEEPEHDNETGTWTNGKGKAAAADAKPVPPADAPPIKEVTSNDAAKKAPQFTPAKSKPVAATATAAPTPSVAIVQAGAPIPAEQPPATTAPAVAKPVIVANNDTPATPAAAPQAAAPAAATAEEKPAAEAAPATPATLPKIRIQLGALKSEAEAESSWTKLSGKFSDSLNGKQHYVVHVTVNGNNFYRLQAGPFNSPQEANETCVTLVSSGQACILAKGK